MRQSSDQSFRCSTAHPQGHIEPISWHLPRNHLVFIDAHLDAGDLYIRIWVCPRDPLARSGGWGYLIGDEGGGYWLGLQTLKAATSMADGFEEKTELYQKIFHHLNISHPDDLISWTYNPMTTNREIAQISELVIEVASSGDPVATKIVESAAEHLFQLYQNLVERLNFIDPPVMFAGGLLTSETILQKILMKKIGLNDVPIPKYSPVAGAALMAQKL